MKSLTYDDLKPSDIKIVENKIKRSVNYARIVLYLNLKAKEGGKVTNKEISNFFNVDEGYIHRVLAFLVNNKLLKKITQRNRVYYIPIENKIKEYAVMSQEKIDGEETK